MFDHHRVAPAAVEAFRRWRRGDGLASELAESLSPPIMAFEYPPIHTCDRPPPDRMVLRQRSCLTMRRLTAAEYIAEAELSLDRTSLHLQEQRRIIARLRKLGSDLTEH